MRISRMLSLAACVAVAISLTACGGSNDSSNAGTPIGSSATASAVPASHSSVASSASISSAPPLDLRTTLHPEMSMVDSVVKDHSGKITCNEDESVPAKLKLGGTITINGVQVITGKQGDYVQFNVNGPFSGYSVIVNGTQAANVPPAALEADTTNIKLDAKDWGPINEVTVCFGGQ